MLTMITVFAFLCKIDGFLRMYNALTEIVDFQLILHNPRSTNAEASGNTNVALQTETRSAFFVMGRLQVSMRPGADL